MQTTAHNARLSAALAHADDNRRQILAYVETMPGDAHVLCHLTDGQLVTWGVAEDGSTHGGHYYRTPGTEDDDAARRAWRDLTDRAGITDTQTQQKAERLTRQLSRANETIVELRQTVAEMADALRRIHGHAAKGLESLTNEPKPMDDPYRWIRSTADALRWIRLEANCTLND